MATLIWQAPTPKSGIGIFFCIILRSGIQSRNVGIENFVLNSVHWPRILDEALTFTETELKLTVDYLKYACVVPNC